MHGRRPCCSGGRIHPLRGARPWAALPAVGTGELSPSPASVGKTITKEMLRVAFAASGETQAARPSFNNHGGVPLTLARLPRSAAYGIYEIGMNHRGRDHPAGWHGRSPISAIITTIGRGSSGPFKWARRGHRRSQVVILSGVRRVAPPFSTGTRLYFEVPRRACADQRHQTSMVGFRPHASGRGPDLSA